MQEPAKNSVLLMCWILTILLVVLLSPVMSDVVLKLLLVILTIIFILELSAGIWVIYLTGGRCRTTRSMLTALIKSLMTFGRATKATVSRTASSIFRSRNAKAD